MFSEKKYSNRWFPHFTSAWRFSLYSQHQHFLSLKVYTQRAFIDWRSEHLKKLRENVPVSGSSFCAHYSQKVWLERQRINVVRWNIVTKRILKKTLTFELSWRLSTCKQRRQADCSLILIRNKNVFSLPISKNIETVTGAQIYSILCIINSTLSD